MGALGDGGEAAGGGEVEEAEGVDEEELGAEDEEHACYWHGEEADGGVGWNGAAGVALVGGRM